MTITAFWYGKAFLSLLNKLIDWDTDVIKVMLTTSTYVPNQDTDDFKDDVTNEVSGAGYSAGGATLGSVTVTYTAGTNVIMLDGADVVWSAATITARVAVVYDSSPATDATRPLLCYQLSSADIVASGGDFTITWAAAGIATITPA